MQVIPELSRGVLETFLHFFLTLTLLDGLLHDAKIPEFQMAGLPYAEIIIFFAILFSMCIYILTPFPILFILKATQSRHCSSK